MQNQKFQRLLQGAKETLSPSQLIQFETHCSSRSIPLQKWIQISLQLYAVDPNHCYQFLSYLDRQQMSKTNFNDFIHQGSKIIIYNNLTGLALTRASRESNKQDHQRWMNEARRYLNSSEKVRMTVDKSIILNRAFLHYYGGEITKALNFVNRTYQEVNKTGEGRHLLTTTTLMLAQIHFIKRNYHKALELYKKCLQISKSLPAKARLGMAYSFFYLGKYELARACFQRIVKLNPSCIEAYVGIAIVYDKEENYSEYFRYISAAYKVNRQHPLVLIHLAQHFLLRGDLLRAEEYCQQGLLAVQRYPKFLKVEDSSRNDYEQLKARFNNILGQIFHINSNYTDAIKYYTLASGKGLLYNEVGLAQSFINPNSLNYIEAIRLLEEVYKQFQGKDGRLLNDSYKLMAYLKSKIPPKGKDEKGAEYYYAQALKYNRQDYQSKIEYANLLVQINKQKALKQLGQVEKILSSNGIGVKPELQNNIAVLQLQNGQTDKSQRHFIKCIEVIEEIQCETQQDEVRKTSLLVISKFNYAICLQKQSRWNAARQLYQQILSLNKYHLDSYLRLAYICYQLGNYSEIMRVFAQIESICTQNKYKLLRADRLYNLKAYLQHLSGNTSEAKETIKLLGKHKDIYTQVFELCMNYQSIMRKGVDLSILKEFLRPNRQFCYKYCNEDHNATFAYMLLAIILLSDKKISKTQGLEYFSNLKQFSADQIPSILYNMGLFMMNYDDSQSSNGALALYKQKVGSNCRGDEITALNYLLDNDFTKSQSYIKRNILRDPSNLKYRLQLAYATERRCNKYYETGDFSKKIVEINICNLKSCMNFYAHLGKIAVFDQIRGIQVPQLKERVRNIYLKIKGCGEERKFYIKSYLDSYEKIQRQVDLKERQKQENQRLSYQKKITQQKEKQLQQLLEQEQDSEDEQQKMKREREKKRQRALEFARKRQEEMDANWNDLLQKDKANEDEKKSRKRGPNVNPVRSAPRTKRTKHNHKDQQSNGSLPQRSQSPSQHQDSPELSLSSEPRKKHKHQKKEKKEKKARRRQSSDDGDAASQSKESKQPSKKDDDDDDLLQKYRC